jgi:hypothetical protein
MVLREDEGAVVCIGQPAHAWVSGQLARAWGNEDFPAPEPREEVCLAAEQHDVGMADWDASPERNPATGRPQSFLEMPVQRHLALWSQAPLRARSQSRYAALLVSLHGTTLYAMRDLDREPPETAAAIRDYLAAQRDLQDRLRETLTADPAYAEHAAAGPLDANRRFVFALDGISLALCLGSYPWSVRDVPGATGSADLIVTGEGTEASVDPWPFAAERLTVRCDGRRLEERFDDQAAMLGALECAPWVTLDLQLAPA